MSLEEKLLGYIVNNTDKNLWEITDENIKRAYEQAQKESSKLLNINYTRYRAQSRRYHIDNAMAGILTSAETLVKSTNPRGETYVVIKSGEITLSHIELHQKNLARKAKHREALAKKNKILEPMQYDFFEDDEKINSVALHLALIIVHPDKKSKEQAKPFDILLTVPYTTWDDYHLKIPVSDVIKSYQDESIGTYGSGDGAWPTLREDLESAERNRDNKRGA